MSCEGIVTTGMGEWWIGSINGDENGWCTLYAYMKLEQWNLLSPFYIVGNMQKEDEGEWWLGESSQGTLLVYM
jgi:hypothetical protein